MNGIGPVIFCRTLGNGFRVFINPVKRPVAFLLIAMPLILWDLLMLVLDLALTLIVAGFQLIKFIVMFISNVRSEAKRTGEL